MTAAHDISTDRVLGDIAGERRAQLAKWGEQAHPDGTDASRHLEKLRDLARDLCDQAFKAGNGTWRHIMNEEIAEAYAEADPAKLRAELVQVAAVATAWIEDIDRRNDE